MAMSLPDKLVKNASNGFEGEVVGLGLSDVIQLNANNRFSGCIAVGYEQSQGLLFFRDGEIIHAEQDGKVGEEAFCCIVGWPGGRFSVQPNVATTRSSIQKSWQHLLLDAHRMLDEQRAARKGQPATAAENAGRPAGAMDAIEKLRQLPGVVQVVLLGKEGARVGDDSYQAEVLAGQGLYLAMAGGRLGSAFHLGEVISGVVQGSTHHLLLFASRGRHLCVLAQGQSHAGAVEAEVRKLLASR
jgi:hypothetical protein